MTFIGYPWILAAVAVVVVAGTYFTFCIQEAPVTRGQAAEQVARERPTIPVGYKKTLWICGIAFAVVYFAEGLVNVQLEPWLIMWIGGVPELSTAPEALVAAFFAVELVSAAVGIAALLAIIASQRRRTWNISVLVIPAGLFGAAFYASLPLTATSLGSYLAWNSLKGVANVVSAVAIERILMDVVRGARKGFTFQVFLVFTVGGSFAGQFVGGILGEVLAMDWLCLLAGAVMAAGVAVYALALAPRLKEAS